MTATTAPTAPPTKNVFRLHGVNVLNRKNVDSISRLTALEKRRATHILDERQRRDTMNQLLAELANLVRESAAELAAAQQQQQQFQQLPQDGSERKPVKSNSITTLRNAIAEIRRLRSCVGLETLTPPCVASAAGSSNNDSRPSSPVSSSPSASQSLYKPAQSLVSLAPQQQQPYQYNPSSCHSTPMSSPKVYPAQAPQSMASHHQLQSPPLSPSSPATHKYSSVSPPLRPTSYMPHPSSASQAHPSALPPLFAPNSPVSHPYQQTYSSQSYYHSNPITSHHTTHH
ncbi:hypothetical protein BGW38_005290, partial [Lunasporangiospora selenospora]